jgi:hypothetical protein
MNTDVSNFLNEYVTYPDPQYAVLLTGKWGCGKTFFIKKWMKDYEANYDHTLQPIYVSLFGCNSIKQINQAIDRVVNPWLYSKWAEVGKKVLNIASKAAFKTELDLNNGGAKETTVNWDIDTLALIGSDEEGIKKFKLIIFDDLERSLIDIRELLGYINNLVEHGKCKVIIVGDVDKIQDIDSSDNNKIFKSFEEKTIGRTFPIQSDIASAVSLFISEPYMSDFFKKDDVIKLIIKTFQSSGFNNLRVLRQALMDYNQLLSKLDEEDIKRGSDFCRILIAEFIIAYMEIKSGDRDVFINMPTERQMIMAGASSENKDKIAHIENKYRDLSMKMDYDLLNPFYLSRINLSITTGKDLSQFVAQQLKGMLNQSLVQKVTTWYTLNNHEFDNLYNEVCEYIMTDAAHSVQEYVSLLEWTSMMDCESIKKQDSVLTTKVTDILSQCLANCKTNEDLYHLRMMVTQGTRQRDGAPNTIFDGVTKWFYSQWNAAIQNHKDQFYEILENVDDKTAAQLSVMQTNVLPDHSTTYSTKAIYGKINITNHINAILRLSNESRIYYAAFLEDRYHLNYGRRKLEGAYMADITPLTKVRNGLLSNIKNYTGVDIYSLKYIIRMIDRILDLAKIQGN